MPGAIGMSRKELLFLPGHCGIGNRGKIGINRGQSAILGGHKFVEHGDQNLHQKEGVVDTLSSFLSKPT